MIGLSCRISASNSGHQPCRANAQCYGVRRAERLNVQPNVRILVYLSNTDLEDSLNKANKSDNLKPFYRSKLLTMIKSRYQ